MCKHEVQEGSIQRGWIICIRLVTTLLLQSTFGKFMSPVIQTVELGWDSVMRSNTVHNS